MPSPPPFIIDAGPALNFLASGHERILINAIGHQPVHAPQTVEDEVLRKASKVSKFKGAAGRWRNMQPNWLRLLSDDSADPALRAAAYTLLNTPLDLRQDNGDDLGETMVVLHAYARAAAGEDVVVIIDDRKGRDFASTARARIDRLRGTDPNAGRIFLTSTTDLVRQRLNTADIPNKDALRQVWADITKMDDGLPNDLPAELLESSRWDGPSRP